IGTPLSSQQSDGRPVYTFPAIVDSTRNPREPQILSNTNSIARPVFLECSRVLQILFVHYIQDAFMKPLLPIMVLVGYDRLPARTQVHFHSTLPPLHPLSLGPAREHAWELVKAQFDFFAIILGKNSGGDTLVTQGRHLSYADALCAVLLWIEHMAPQDGWVRIRDWNDGRWARLRNRCQEYMDVL
ncbi:hypothetical protein K438DRAFT_1622884, partial [Mycena galopus ATCC 62051]